MDAAAAEVQAIVQGQQLLPPGYGGLILGPDPEPVTTPVEEDPGNLSLRVPTEAKQDFGTTRPLQGSGEDRGWQELWSVLIYLELGLQVLLSNWGWFPLGRHSAGKHISVETKTAHH